MDGSGVGDVGAVVLRDRKILAEDGMVVIIINVQNGQLLSRPGSSPGASSMKGVRGSDE